MCRFVSWGFLVDNFFLSVEKGPFGRLRKTFLSVEELFLSVENFLLLVEQ